MIRVALVGFAFFLMVLGLEHGLLPNIGVTESRLVAFAVILAGCLRGELQALGLALMAAALAGPSYGESYWGCTIISFGVAGYAAASLARAFYFDQFPWRVAILLVLIVGESLLWSVLRGQLFADRTLIDVQWVSHGAMALIGAAIYPVLRRYLGRTPPAPEPIGRRRNTD